MFNAEFTVVVARPPDRPSFPIAILLVDYGSGRLFARFRPHWWKDCTSEGDAVVWEAITKEFEADSGQADGLAIIDSLESASHVIELLDRSEITIGEVREALAKLYRIHVESTVSPVTPLKSTLAPFFSVLGAGNLTKCFSCAFLAVVLTGSVYMGKLRMPLEASAPPSFVRIAEDGMPSVSIRSQFVYAALVPNVRENALITREFEGWHRKLNRHIAGRPKRFHPPAIQSFRFQTVALERPTAPKLTLEPTLETEMNMFPLQETTIPTYRSHPYRQFVSVILAPLRTIARLWHP
jgi:hypothetical protein